MGTSTAAGVSVESSSSNGTEDRPSIGGLLSDVSKDFSDLVRQEIALAKAEATQSATRAGKSAGMFGGAAIGGYFVLLFLSIALWWGLGSATGRTWSAIIVAAIWAVIAAILALVGKKQMDSVRGLPRTAETVKKIPPAMKGHEEENV
jgi:hypothetical protein